MATKESGATLLIVDDLQFSLKRSTRRKTMQITVDRGGELLISAPPNIDEARLREFIEEKRFWIYTKLAEKNRLLRSMPNKEFVDGEGFLYLGRSYRLKLVDDQDTPLKLLHGRFMLHREFAADGRALMIQWYCVHAKGWLWDKIGDYAARMEVQPAGVKVQDLGYRWGSCGKGNWLYFHWKTILLPPRIAEYVVIHELAHLHHPHHTPEFWQRIERSMPDYEQRKIWLAEHGMSVEGL